MIHRLGLVSRRALLAATVTTALLLTTVAGAIAVTPHPASHLVQLPPGAFTAPGGGSIQGWYWMTSPSYSDKAVYQFDGFDPSALSFDRKLAVMVAPLVTNTTSGGSGWGARLHVTVTYGYTGGSRVWNYHVLVTNPFPLQSSLDSGGVGYQAYGKLTLNKSQFTHGVGSLRIQVTREASYVTSGFHPHVAVNATALSVWYLTP